MICQMMRMITLTKTDPNLTGRIKCVKFRKILMMF